MEKGKEKKKKKERKSELLAIRAQDNAGQHAPPPCKLLQEEDKHRPQNMFVNGHPSWTDIQLDETAYVILLVSLGIAQKRTAGRRISHHFGKWFHRAFRVPSLARNHNAAQSMGRRSRLLRVDDPSGNSGNVSADCRGNSGIPGRIQAGESLRETADCWNAEIESLLYVTDTQLGGGKTRCGRLLRATCPTGARIAWLLRQLLARSRSAIVDSARVGF